MTLGSADLAVIAGYVVVILLVGWWFGRKEESTHDYFLGGRRQPWLIVGLSILATELSALTFVTVPAESFRSDCSYLQLFAGAFIGRIIIIAILLPAFYRGSVTTVYEYLGQRFGPGSRTTASLLFFVNRIVGSSIRLLAASLALAIVFDWPLTWVIVGSAAIAVAYTAFGGIKAIVWTDALQALVFLGGALAVVVFLLSKMPGSAGEIIDTAREAGKLDVFHWSADPNDTRALWVLVVYAVFLNTAAFGVDQDLTQRMLTCRDVRRSQYSLLFNALAGLPVVCLFLLIGVLMFAYYQAFPQNPPPRVAGTTDHAFPHFIATALPAGWGLQGLLVAGIIAAAMSSLDSALGALSSSAVVDFYKPFIRPRAADQHYVLVGRLFVVAFGALLVLVALAFAGRDQLLWEAFQWAGLVYGSMLGVFLLGVTTRTRGRDGLNVAAMISAVLALVLLKAFQEHSGKTYIAWPWWIVLGTVWTYLVGILFPPRSRK